VNAIALLILGAIGWLVRRAIGDRVERSTLERLPLDPDGIVRGAAGVVRQGSTERAVLIVHGFGDTPQTVYYLADHLHALGFTVHAPLLPGHGRTLREFAGSGAAAWLAAAKAEFSRLRRDYGFLGVVGVSMGGALSVIVTAEINEADPASRAHGARERAAGPDALVLIAPYLSMRPRAYRIARLHWMLWPFIRYLPSREEASIRDPLERASNRGFGTVTPRLLNELLWVVERAERVLPKVGTPTLVIQSREDNRVDQAAATRSFEMLGAREKDFVWTEGSGHVITVDVGREHVLERVGAWLIERAAAPRSMPRE
jgi:carboxylesterase